MLQTQHLAEAPGDQGIHGSLRLTFCDPYCWIRIWKPGERLSHLQSQGWLPTMPSHPPPNPALLT